MRPFEVVAYDSKESMRTVMCPDRYAFTPAKGFTPLQRACFWLLRKLGCQALDEELTVKRQRISPDDVVRALFEQREVAERLGSGNASQVFMGPEDYARLMREPWVAGKVSFTAISSRSREFMGLTITIVPWMEGILVV